MFVKQSNISYPPDLFHQAQLLTITFYEVLTPLATSLADIIWKLKTIAKRHQ